MGCCLGRQSETSEAFRFSGVLHTEEIICNWRDLAIYVLARYQSDGYVLLVLHYERYIEGGRRNP